MVTESLQEAWSGFSTEVSMGVAVPWVVTRGLFLPVVIVDLVSLPFLLPREVAFVLAALLFSAGRLRELRSDG